ncbi:hypothetical protein ACFFX0_09995 [Citricoccus parietis]|uniref:Uncharacterized protein n=1 Tax=Citricoccus parietis TaxID=592307 RepID=A0ABV5FXV1_9MICC
MGCPSGRRPWPLMSKRPVVRDTNEWSCSRRGLRHGQLPSAPSGSGQLSPPRWWSAPYWSTFRW